jgi:hypothetical protein
MHPTHIKIVTLCLDLRIKTQQEDGRKCIMCIMCDEEIKENKINKTYSVDGRNEKFINNFGKKS